MMQICESASYNGRRRYCNNYLNRKRKIWYTEDDFEVTTLYFPSLSKEVKRDNIVEHFSAYGNMGNIQIYNPRTSGYVRFTPAESIPRPITIEFHIIAGEPTWVKIADRRHQYNSFELQNSLATATTTTTTHFLHINDDCLYEIFSLKFVTLIDLCSIAATSTRFKNISNRIFVLSHKICYLQSLVDTIYEAGRILVIFGSLISELTIGGIEFDNEESIHLLDLVTNCCVNTLDSLKLYDIVIPEYLTIKLRPLFRNLRKLYIFDCPFKGATRELFANCESLMELTAFGRDEENWKFIFDNRFPNLELFEYDDADIDFDLQVFISRHMNLKILHIRSLGNYLTLCPTIAENCKQLEELQIGCHVGSTFEYEKALKSLLSLDYLRKLKINCGRRNFTKFTQHLSVLKSLEFLELQFVRGDSEFISVLSQLKSLQVLRLILCTRHQSLNLLGNLHQLTELSITSDDIVDIDPVLLIERQINLKILKIYVRTFKIDKNMYFRIVDVVLKRLRKSQHTIDITCYTADNLVGDLLNDRYNHQWVKLHTLN